MSPAARPGWQRLARAVADIVPPGEVDRVWLFDPLRREGREWGTAVVSRVDGERRRIYTAQYVLAIRGKERGRFETTVQEVGSGPAEVLGRLLHDVQRRGDEQGPPVAVPPGAWFATAADASPR